MTSPVSPDPLLARHRVILCHFDGYSTALVFARWDSGSLLWPGALPAGAAPVEATVGTGDAAAVRQAAIDALGLNADEVILMPDFDECVQADGGEPIRVHLLRFTTFEAPKALIEPSGGVFKPLPALRGSAPVELGLLREVFNLIIGGGGRHGA